MHVDRYTPDDRSDRPALGAIRGARGTLVVEGGASVAHLGAFAAELAARGRPPVVGIALTHWHWDHSFGSAAIDAPVIAHADTAAELAVQAAYDWSDEALDQRVRDGREIAFCAEFLRVELPDRSDLEIVLPSETFTRRHTVDLGGVRADIVHVGGDHAADSCVVHVPGDDVLFLGDCLYQRLYAPEPMLTVAGVRSSTGSRRSRSPSPWRATTTTSPTPPASPPGWPGCAARPTSSTPRGPGRPPWSPTTRTWPSWSASCSSARPVNA